MSEETLTEIPQAVPERLLPYVGPIHLEMPAFTAIVDDLVAKQFAFDTVPPFHEKEKRLEKAPKVLVVGTDEHALEAVEALTAAGFAVVVTEEETRPHSLTHLGEDRAKWGLKVLSHPNTILLTKTRLTSRQVQEAGFSGVVLSYELQNDITKTEADMSLPLVIPARSLLLPGPQARDIDHKLADPDNIVGGKRLGRLVNGKIGRIAITGVDPVQTLEAAHRVATIHVADAAHRKTGVGFEYFRYGALTRGNLGDIALSLGLVPGDVGATSIIAPDSTAFFQQTGVDRDMLRANNIGIIENATVLGTTATESPGIIHVNIRHQITNTRPLTGVKGLSGLVVADGMAVDFGINGLTVPVVRVGQARHPSATSQTEAIREMIQTVQTQGRNPEDQVFRVIDTITGNGQSQRVNYVTDWLVSSMPIFWNGHTPQAEAGEKKEQTPDQVPVKKAEPDMESLVGHEVPPFVLPYLRNPEEVSAQWMTIRQAAEAVWARYGKSYKDTPVKSYEDWLAAKRNFHEEAGHVEIAIFGGGAGAYIAAARIRAKFKNAHVVIFEKENHMGGMALEAISPFVDDHEQTKISAARTVMQTMMDPGVDVITSFEVKDREIPWMAKQFGFKVMIDARGAEPNHVEHLHYDGERVMTISHFLAKVNRPYDRDGHFGNVRLPVTYSASGTAHNAIIVAGGLAGIDALLATELVRTVDDIERKWNIPRHLIDISALLDGGLYKNRTGDQFPKLAGAKPGLGFPHMSHAPTEVIYRGELGMSRIEKLLIKAPDLPREDREMKKLIEAELRRRQGMYGGYFSGDTAIISQRTDPHSGNLIIGIGRPGSRFGREMATSFVATAVRYQTRDVVPGTIRIGIGKSGAGDLKVTGDTIKEAMPAIEAAIAAAQPSNLEQAHQFVGMIEGHQTSSGQRWTDSTPVDPIVQFMTRAPESLIAKGFRQKPEVQSSPVQQEEHSVSAPGVDLTTTVASTVEVPIQRNDILDALERVHADRRAQLAEVMSNQAEPLGLPVQMEHIALPDVVHVERACTTLDGLRNTVRERRDAHVRAVVLTQLRDTLQVRAREGGYNDPRDTGLPEADTLNMLMNLREEDIELRQYFTGGKTRRKGTEDEGETGDYLSIHIHDRRRGHDETRELPIRMLANGTFQYHANRQWYTIHSVNALRRALGREFGVRYEQFSGDGYAYMHAFQDRLRREVARDGLAYTFAQLRAIGRADNITTEQLTFLVRQLHVSNEGNLYVRRTNRRSGVRELDWLVSDRAARRLFSRILARGETLPSRSEQTKEDARDFLARYQYTASLVLGLFAKAGIEQLTQNPRALNDLTGIAVGWGLLMNRLMARVKHGYAAGTTDHSMVQLMERITGHVAAFGVGLLISEPVADLWNRFTGGETMGAQGVAAFDSDTTVGTESPQISVPEMSPNEPAELPDDVAGSDVPPVQEPAEVTTAPEGSFDASIYHGEWQEQMIDMVDMLGGSEGWMNTVDNNGVSQAEVMSGWRILLEGKVADADLAGIIDRIAQTKDIHEYMQLRETLLEDVRALLR